MVIKVLVSGISASKEVKKRQQRAMLILDSAQVEYEPVDITEPGREEERANLLEAWKQRNGEGTPLPPQFFNDGSYLGDFEDFNLAVDVNEILQFLKLSKPEEAPTSHPHLTTNGAHEANNRVSEQEEQDVADVIENEEVLKKNKDLLEEDEDQEEDERARESESGEHDDEEAAADDAVRESGETVTKRKEPNAEEGDEESDAESKDANKKFKPVSDDDEVEVEKEEEEGVEEGNEHEEEEEEEEVSSPGGDDDAD